MTCGNATLHPIWEFHGGPVVRTQHLHVHGPVSVTGQGTKIPQALWHGEKKHPAIQTKNITPHFLKAVLCLQYVFIKKANVLGHIMFYFIFISLGHSCTQWIYWKGNTENLAFLWRDSLLCYCVISVCDTTSLRFRGSGKTLGMRWQKDSVLKGEWATAPHSSTLAWKIPWTEEPGRLQSMGSLRVKHDWATSLWLFTFMHWRRNWQPTPVSLPRESQEWGSLVGCRLWGCTESDMTEAT